MSLVGGFDYYSNQFNRVTQAHRQPGSGFKPFLYSAALENGFTPASVILDTPIVVDDGSVEGGWRPENFEREFGGPTRMREALVHSRNLVSIRILRALGIPTAIDYATRFGFEKTSLPDNLTLALGTVDVTPLQLAAGYAAFANGGYKIAPYLIDRIENSQGKLLYQAAPVVVCRECSTASTPPTAAEAAAATGAPAGAAATPQAATTPTPTPAEAPVDATALPPLAPLPSPEQIAARNADAPAALRDLAAAQGGRGYLKADRVAPRIITAQNAWLMTDMMADVIKRGTGRRAMALGRNDLAGKTGTTNGPRDTWFNGFTGNLVSTVWVGFDDERTLGEREEGASTAVPIWMHFMREALRGMPERPRAPPPGIVALHISPSTGAVVNPADPGALTEYFIADKLPRGVDPAALDRPPPPASQGNGENLF